MTTGLLRVTSPPQETPGKRVVLNEKVEVWVKDGDESVVEEAGGYWLDVSKAVRKIVPVLEINHPARVTVEFFAVGVDLAAMELPKATVDGMRAFVKQWDEAYAAGKQAAKEAAVKGG